MHTEFLVFQLLTPKKVSLIAVIVAFSSWIPSSHAQTIEAKEGGQWSVGLGAVVVDKVYRDIKQETYPLPVVGYENKWVSISVPTLDVKLFTGESISFRLRARWAADGYEAKDSPFLTGMDERKESLWAGGAIIWKTDIATLTAELLADAMSNSKGTRAKVQIDRRFAVGKFGFTPRFAVERVDEKYVDYYYGVKQSEVQAGRGFYEGKATTNMQFGLRADYTPAPHHLLFLDVGAVRFGSSIEDSPLVDKSNQTSVGLGYIYRF